MKTFTFLVMTVFLALSETSFSQWSSDPLQNTPVDTSDFDQNLPEIAIDQETGNIFIAYFSQVSGNYNMILQYFNHQGDRLWQEPLVVSNNPQDGMLTDFSALTDNDGNCVITFSDIRNGTPDIYIYKVSPEGQQLWGEQGIRLSRHPEAEYAPVLCITQENNAIVSWTEVNPGAGDNLVMAAIDQNGNLLWNMGRIIWFPDGDYSYAGPNLLPSNDGDFIVVYKKTSGQGWLASGSVFARRLNISGESVWNSETPVNDAGGLTSYANLSLKSDSEGGFYVAWDDDRDGDEVSEAFIQHVNASGNLLFTANGLSLSTEFSQRFYPLVAGWNDNKEVFVYWQQLRIDKEKSNGLFGQKISKDGNRMWTDKGKMIIMADIGLNRIIGCDVQNNLSYLFFIMNEIDASDQRIRAKCVDNEGISAWETDQLPVSEVPKEIAENFVSDYSSGQWILAWSDVRDTNDYNLYAQNVNEDGSIGNPTGIDEYDQPVIIVYPNPCNETINFRQDGYSYLCIFNPGGQVVLERKINSGDNTVNVSSFDPGIYFLKLSGLKGSTVQKIVITGR